MRNSDRDPPDVLGGIPSSREIRRQLAIKVREADVLRRLLKVAIQVERDRQFAEEIAPEREDEE